jgi:hypothetical protein
MALAREGAILAVETLKVGDQVGVIAFDYTANWISDVRTIRGPADIRAVSDAIARLRPDGGTEFSDALNKAYRGLQQVEARIKHVILMTDGEAPETNLPQLLAAMRRAGITVSTVGVSGDISGSGQAVLQRIANAGRGRFYFTSTANDVPQILTQETRLAGRSLAQERDFTPRLATAAPAVRGLVPAEFPPLHGYVRVSPRPAAETVLRSDQDEAILAQWQYGLGRSVAWTADAQGQWSRDWVGTDAFRRLWPQAVRWTMPAPSDPTLQVAIHGDAEFATIRVESAEPGGAFRNLLATYADVAPPQGAGRRIPLPQVAPGRYEGRVPLAGPGAYFVRVTQANAAGTIVAEATTGYALPYLPEYLVTPANRILLERLAADSGGPLVNMPAEAWRRDTRHGLQPREIWDWLIQAALALFVADVALRRLRPSGADLAVLGTAAGGRVRAGLARWGAWRPALPALHPLLTRRSPRTRR